MPLASISWYANTVWSTENTVSQTCLFIHHFCLVQVQDRPLHTVPFHQLVSLSSSWKTTTSKHTRDEAGYPPGWTAFILGIVWMQRKLMDFIWWNELRESDRDWTVRLLNLISSDQMDTLTMNYEQTDCYMKKMTSCIFTAECFCEALKTTQHLKRFSDVLLTK